jgi:hypothetical protein
MTATSLKSSGDWNLVAASRLNRKVFVALGLPERPANTRLPFCGVKSTDGKAIIVHTRGQADHVDRFFSVS